jgi:glutathione S-transferase
VLEVDGTPIAQSMAIMRYLGKEHGIIFIFSLLSFSKIQNFVFPYYHLLRMFRVPLLTSAIKD